MNTTWNSMKWYHRNLLSQFLMKRKLWGLQWAHSEHAEAGGICLWKLRSFIPVISFITGRGIEAVINKEVGGGQTCWLQFYPRSWTIRLQTRNVLGEAAISRDATSVSFAPGGVETKPETGCMSRRPVAYVVMLEVVSWISKCQGLLSSRC